MNLFFGMTKLLSKAVSIKPLGPKKASQVKVAVPRDLVQRVLGMIDGLTMSASAMLTTDSLAHVYMERRRALKVAFNVDRPCNTRRPRWALADLKTKNIILVPSEANRERYPAQQRCGPATNLGHIESKAFYTSLRQIKAGGNIVGIWRPNTNQHSVTLSQNLD
jgi:hypothetical protein